jgi:hypothetical protein
MHAQFRERFAGSKMKIAQYDIALNRRRVVGRLGAKRREQDQE